jgi:HK97 family phage major capsid protein
MPEITNSDAAAMRVRLSAAQRAREDVDSGEITPDEFRNQLVSIAGDMRGEVRKNHGGTNGKTKAEGSENKDNRSKLGLPDLETADHRATRKNGSKAYKPNKKLREIQGKPNEPLNVRDGHSVEEYVRRAAENGVTTTSTRGASRKVTYQDQEYRNTYFGARMGLTNHAGEARALLEDTTNSGLAVVPESWSAQVIPFLYADSVMGRLGMTVIPMATEKVHIPQFANPPAFVATSEGQPVGVDANAAFETGFELNAAGSYRCLLTVSRELAQDHFVEGTLDSYLAEQVGKSLALTVDQAAIFGTALPGCPGLVNETGFVTRTPTGYSSGGYALTDTSEFSLIREQTRVLNAHPTGFLLSDRVLGTVARLRATTYASYWRMPSDVADMDFVTTSNNNILPSVETDGLTPAPSGGSSSSIYSGPWPYVTAGVRLDSMTMQLDQRFAEFGLIGYATFVRFSIRTALPGTFTRTSSIASV